jgi:hypothetical protein
MSWTIPGRAVTDFSAAVADWIDASMRVRAAVVETACEEAIRGGRFGVLVETEIAWGGYRIIAKVDPSVPYGEIHER